MVGNLNPDPGNDHLDEQFEDSLDMYRSRLEELSVLEAAKTHTGSLERQAVDHFKELTFSEKKAIHNLKYFTWVEQQGKTYEEICAQWDPDYWRQLFTEEAAEFDKLIEGFNKEVGLGSITT